MQKTKFLHVTMPDGSIWRINIDSLKVAYLVRVKGITEIQALDDQKKNLPPSDEELIEIARKELDWYQIRDYATCVQLATQSDYQSGWKYGKSTIKQENE